MNTLERDLKSPTLGKLSERCEVRDVHPPMLLAQVREELEAITRKGAG